MNSRADLRGNVAVVTGGAGEGSGLGSALVRRLAGAGMRVAILDINGQAADQLASELQSQGAEAVGVEVDITDPNAVQDAADFVGRTYGACNVLCAHVGGAGMGRFDTLTIADWRNALELMVVGTVTTTRTFLPLVRAADGIRRIVLTASVAGLKPGRYQGPYRAAKAAVISIGETLDLELAHEDIGTTIVFPSGMAPAELIDFARVTTANLTQLASGNPILAAVVDEMTPDPRDIVTADDAAAPVIDAIVERKRYVVTHGVSARDAARDRHALLDEAFADAARRRHARLDEAGF